MTDTKSIPTPALDDFFDGFRAGRNGAPREKNWSAGYRRAWAKGVRAAEDAEMWAAKRLMREMKGAVA